MIVIVPGGLGAGMAGGSGQADRPEAVPDEAGHARNRGSDDDAGGQEESGEEENGHTETHGGLLGRDRGAPLGGVRGIPFR
jgi:hypothetical protein